MFKEKGLSVNLKVLIYWLYFNDYSKLSKVWTQLNEISNSFNYGTPASYLIYIIEQYDAFITSNKGQYPIIKLPKS